MYHLLRSLPLDPGLTTQMAKSILLLLGIRLLAVLDCHCCFSVLNIGPSILLKVFPSNLVMSHIYPTLRTFLQ